MDQVNMYLKPSEIYYSRESIGCRFSHGERLGETLDALCEGRATISALPIITVLKIGDNWITPDNRRLWVFRQVERLGKCDKIPVHLAHGIDSYIIPCPNGVNHVVIDGDPGGKYNSSGSDNSSGTSKLIGAGVLISGAIILARVLMK